MSSVIDLDNHRGADYHLQRLKELLNAQELVVSSVNENGTISTLIQEGVSDYDLVYIIQCLKDRRQARIKP